jgi:hypothetical protein
MTTPPDLCLVDHGGDVGEERLKHLEVPGEPQPSARTRSTMAAPTPCPVEPTTFIRNSSRRSRLHVALLDDAGVGSPR